MIAIEKPEGEQDLTEYDKITVPGGLWAVAYGRFDGNNTISAGKCWKMIDQYLEETQYISDESIPVIEKFPDGVEPLDQTYMLMRPLITRPKGNL